MCHRVLQSCGVLALKVKKPQQLGVSGHKRDKPRVRLASAITTLRWETGCSSLLRIGQRSAANDQALEFHSYAKLPYAHQNSITLQIRAWQKAKKIRQPSDKNQQEPHSHERPNKWGGV